MSKRAQSSAAPAAPAPRPAAPRGERKAAIAILALGDEVARQIFGMLSADEVERIVYAAEELREIPADEVIAVLEELDQLLDVQVPGVFGHRGRLQKAAASVLGRELVAAMLAREAGTTSPELERVAAADPAVFARDLSREHPQVVAVVLAMMGGAVGSKVMAHLPLELKSEAVKRMATLRAVPAAVLEQVTKLVGSASGRAEAGEPVKLDGMKAAVDILKSVDPDDEEEILGTVEDEDSELAEDIRSRMFQFDDLLMLHARQVQQVLREIDSQVLTLALKNASSELKEHMLSNMSSRAAMLILDDLEAMGPTPLAKVEEAQAAVVSAVMQMAADGKLSLRPGSTV